MIQSFPTCSKNIFLSAAFLTFAVGCAIPSIGQQSDGQRPSRNGPPPEAYEACSSKSADQSCSMNTPHGQLSGTCATPPSVNALVCVPENHNMQRDPQGSRGDRQGQARPSAQSGPSGFGGSGGGIPAPRTHNITQSSGEVTLYPAIKDPIAPNSVNMRIENGVRIISANSVSVHKTGTFPNPGNPNTISEQSTLVRVPAYPDSAALGQPETRRVFGYAVNGVKFEPSAGEMYASDSDELNTIQRLPQQRQSQGSSGRYGQPSSQSGERRRPPPPPRGGGDRGQGGGPDQRQGASNYGGPPNSNNSGTQPVRSQNAGPRWQYEALSGAIPLGLDENHAHVQPTGHYHYHAMPTGLLERLGAVDGQHSPLVGYAVDGFPIYARFGYAEDNRTIEMKRSGWRKSVGNRPTGAGNPGGYYDGTFTADYEFVGAGNLDVCNGAHVISPEYPNGTYAYFITDDWPFIPRCIRGEALEAERGPGGR